MCNSSRSRSNTDWPKEDWRLICYAVITLSRTIWLISNAGLRRKMRLLHCADAGNHRDSIKGVARATPSRSWRRFLRFPRSVRACSACSVSATKISHVKSAFNDLLRYTRARDHIGKYLRVVKPGEPIACPYAECCMKGTVLAHRQDFMVHARQEHNYDVFRRSNW